MESYNEHISFALNNSGSLSLPTSRAASPVVSSFKLIKTNLKDNLLYCDNVVLKETYVLKVFSITNVLALAINVKLKSDLADQIKFQLENENIRNVTEPFFQEDDYNQLFNDVNLIDEVTIGPLGTVTIVASYRPLAHERRDEDETSDQEDEEEQRGPTTSRNRYYEVKGTITLYASVAETPAIADLAPPEFSENEKTVGIKFVARVCKSVLKVSTHEIAFEDCVVGKSFVRDFTVWNSSEMPLDFELSYKGSKECSLEFYNNETGALITSVMQIPGYYHMTVRVNYKPSELGEFSYKIKVENKKNSNNAEYVSVNSVVSTGPQDHTAYITVTEKINFGECFTSMPASQFITVRNISQDPVDVHFNCDIPNEISFYLHTARGSDSNDEDDVDAKHLGSHLALAGSVPGSPQSPPVTSTVRGLNMRRIPFNFVEKTGVSPQKVDQDKEKLLERIEEITLYPGHMQRVVEVRYIPSRTEESDAKAQKLHRRKFEIHLKVTDSKGRVKEKKKIKASSRICTSLIKIPKPLIHMGDCPIGTRRNGVFEVMNLSDLPTEVQLQYESKAVSFKKHQYTIPPRQSVDVMFDFLPRKVSPDYRKEITFVNVNNRENDQFVEISANNMDEQRLSVHSLFYRTVIPYSRSYLDFDSVIVNSPMVRTFTIKNIIKQTLALKLSTALPDEVKLYKQVKSAVSQAPSHKRKEQLMKHMEEREASTDSPSTSETAKIKKRHMSITEPDIPNLFPEIKEPEPITPSKQSILNLENSLSSSKSLGAISTSWSEKSFFDRPLSTLSDRSQSPLVDSLSLNSSSSSLVFSPPTTKSLDFGILSKQFVIPESIPVFNAKQEEEYIQGEVSRLEMLEKAMNDGLLVPVSELELSIGEEALIYAILTPNGAKRPSIKAKLKKFDSKIFFELNDPSLLNEEEKEPPIRELFVTAKICRSIMNLAQKNINFGDIRLDDHKAKTLVIHNESEVPLVYKIRKTGSMASLDFKISKEDRTGIIRPYRSREVHFFFKPTLNEPYSEKLVIENIYDRSNNQIVQVKANIFKARTFYLKSLEIDFGPCMIGEVSRAQAIVVNNITKKKRSYTIVADEHSFEYCVPEIIFRLGDENEKVSSHSLTFSLEAGGKQKISTTLLFQGKSAISRSFEEGRGSILVYEAKNSDIYKKLHYNATACFSTETYKEKMQDAPPQVEKVLSDSAPSSGNPSPLLSPKSSRRNVLGLTPNFIDLGEFPVTSSAKSQFVITNMSPTEQLEFVLLEQQASSPILEASKEKKTENKTGTVFKFNDIKGKIEPLGKYTVRFTCTLTHPGKQRHSILIANAKGQIQGTVIVAVSPLKRQYIRFPSIDNDVLDLGNCYIDSNSTYAKVVPLRIKSVYNNTICLSVQSNLANQVLVFQDRELTIPASDVDTEKSTQKTPEIYLKALFNTQVYVCLQPSTKSDTYNKGQCRNLVGGLRVKVYDTKKALLDEVFIKFTAVVGKSILHVSNSFIDLGITRYIGKTFTGSFTISNCTTNLPTNFTILTNRAKYIQLECVQGHLDATEQVNGTSSKEIKYSITTQTYGLIQEWLVIKNEYSGQLLELGVRLFVDEDILSPDLETVSLTFNDIYLQSESLANFLNKKRFSRLSSAVPEYKSITLENKTSQDIVLYPKTNLNILVMWKDIDKGDDRDYTCKDSSALHLCGKAFKLRARSKVNAYVCFPMVLSGLTPGKTLSLSQGKRVEFKGIVVFERELDTADDETEDEGLMRVSKLIYVDGSYCVSLGEVVPTVVNMGSVVYDNGWTDVPFEFELRNFSEVPLYAQIPAIHPALTISDISQDGKVVVDPLQMRKLSAVFSPAKIKSPPGSFRIDVKINNVHNPLNKLNLAATAEITPLALRFSRLDEGDLIIPPLVHPSEIPADNWLIVQNIGDRNLDIAVRVDIVKEIEKYINIEVLGRRSNTIIPQETSFSISPTESIELLVRVRANSAARIPPEFVTDKIMVLGTLNAVSTSGIVDTVVIRGSFVRGNTFAVTPNRLHFDITTLEEAKVANTENTGIFTISNPFPTFSVSYKINASKVPDKINISIEPTEGTLGPKGSQDIVVTVRVLEPVHLSESVNLSIIDVEYPNQVQTLNLSMLGGIRQKIPRRGTSVQFEQLLSPTSRELAEEAPDPIFSLKGCTPLGSDSNRYEINLGQQVFGAGNVVWELIIQNDSELSTTANKKHVPVEYKIYTVNKDDENWMTLSRTGGIIESVGDSHSISLTFSTKKMDTFTTYIMIENCHNPHNVKTVRVNFKVVATQNTFFSVLVDGKQTSNPVIDFGEVYFDYNYQDRYFVIVNDHHTPLDMLLSTNLTPQDSTEVNFSLSRTSINLVNWLTVDAMNSVRIFVHFRPSKSHPNEDEEEIEEPTSPVEQLKNVEIYVSCSVVKDFQQLINLKAICKNPQMQVSGTCLVFAAQVLWKQENTVNNNNNNNKRLPGNRGSINNDEVLDDTEISFPKDQRSKQILLSNNFHNHLEYILKNDSLFFNVEGANDGAIVSKYIPHFITIKPNLPVILKNKRFLLKEKYIEEHITIYNKSQLTERYWISLRLTLGHLTDFYSAPGPKVQYPLTTLEGTIISFLREARIFWEELLREQSTKSKKKDLNYTEMISTIKSEELGDEQIYFMYHYITDELVFFGLKKQAGKFAFQLANLLFNTLLRLEIFGVLLNAKTKPTKQAADALTKWVKRLVYFLSWFPEKRKALADLRTYEHDMLQALESL